MDCGSADAVPFLRGDPSCESNIESNISAHDRDDHHHALCLIRCSPLPPHPTVSDQKGVARHRSKADHTALSPQTSGILRQDLLRRKPFRVPETPPLYPARWVTPRARPRTYSRPKPLSARPRRPTCPPPPRRPCSQPRTTGRAVSWAFLPIVAAKGKVVGGGGGRLGEGGVERRLANREKRMEMAALLERTGGWWERGSRGRNTRVDEERGQGGVGAGQCILKQVGHSHDTWSCSIPRSDGA